MLLLSVDKITITKVFGLHEGEERDSRRRARQVYAEMEVAFLGQGAPAPCTEKDGGGDYYEYYAI